MPKPAKKRGRPSKRAIASRKNLRVAVPGLHKTGCACPVCSPRPRMYDFNILTSIDQEAFDGLADLCKATGLKRNDLVRMAIGDLLASEGAQATVAAWRAL